MSLLSLTSILAVSMFGLVTSEFATAKGRILCNGVPMKYVKVSLKDGDTTYVDDVFGTSRTDSNGYFTVSGTAVDAIGAGTPDPYIQVDYYYSGYYGTFDIQDGTFLPVSGTDRTLQKTYSTLLDFGNINFNNEKCKTYQNMFEALVDYRVRTGIPPPVAIEVNVNVQNGGRLYSTTDTIDVPVGYNNGNGLSLIMSKHELAHIVRHYYDGSIAHFYSDSTAYNYYRTETCDDKIDYGFAFNEGWADYWANLCTSSTGIDYQMQGNVATALRKLKTKCASTEYKMVNVLKTYPGVIHSFTEYNNKHYALYSCKL